MSADVGLGTMPGEGMAPKGPKNPTGVGAPARAGQAARNRITIRLTDAEYEVIEAAAGDAKLADWIRRIVIARARRKLAK